MAQSFQLDITNPCQEVWETFTPTVDGGFCASCNKNVVDFTRMADSELVAFFRDWQKTDKALCGRFHENQLRKNYVLEEWFPKISEHGKTVSFEIPVSMFDDQTSQIQLPQIKRNNLIRQIAACVITFFSIQEGIAQNRLISGQVFDKETGESLPQVSISIKGTKRGVVSDSTGKYEITAVQTDTLIFSFIGYETIKLRIPANAHSLDASMNSEPIGLGEVDFVGYSNNIKKTITGGVEGVRVLDSNAHCESPGIDKYETNVRVMGNAVQGGTLTLVPEAIVYCNNNEINTDRQWFEEHGFQEIHSLQVYDYSGKVYTSHFTKISDGMVSVDVKNLIPGAYIARMIYRNERSLTENEVATIRILIER